MRKARPAVVRQMDENYEKACYAYVAELARMWNIILNAGCYWIGEPGDVYEFDGAWTLGMKDIIYAVRKGVTPDQANDWQEYVVFAKENDFQCPSMQEYMENRVPLLDADAQQRISKLRYDLLRLCNDEREKMLSNFLDRENVAHSLNDN